MATSIINIYGIQRWNHLSIGKSHRFSMYQYFASIMDRIQDKIKTAPAITVSDQARHADIMIIIADDDQDDRELFVEVISEISSKIIVRSVEDCFQLMHILKDVNNPLPDILFLDLNMPGMSGKQCLREIKKDERLNKLPVVIYSTSSLIKDINDTYSIGANCYIQKPNSFKMAISLIKKVFSIDFEDLKAPPDLKNFVLTIDCNK